MRGSWSSCRAGSIPSFKGKIKSAWDLLYILPHFYMGEKGEGEEEQVDQLQGRVNHSFSRDNPCLAFVHCVLSLDGGEGEEE